MPLAFVATILIAYLPYLSVGPLGVLGFLPGYASERGMVSGEQFFLLTVARRLVERECARFSLSDFCVAVLGIVVSMADAGSTRAMKFAICETAWSSLLCSWFFLLHIFPGISRG